MLLWPGGGVTPVVQSTPPQHHSITTGASSVSSPPHLTLSQVWPADSNPYKVIEPRNVERAKVLQSEHDCLAELCVLCANQANIVACTLCHCGSVTMLLTLQMLHV